MRVVIDMQGAQSESRFRGIGRYTMSFAQAIALNKSEHDIILALSGLFPNTIEPIRASFKNILPQENIVVWHAIGPTAEIEPSNQQRRELAQALRQNFLSRLQPDIIHISSLFEGYGDDAVTDISTTAENAPTSASFYDLIPLINREKYLDGNPRYRDHYLRKLDHLKKCNLLLAISASALKEIDLLNAPSIQRVNVSTATEPHFRKQRVSPAEAKKLTGKFSITRRFLLCTGGADERKNLTALISAFASLPLDVRTITQLVFAGKIPDGNIALLKREASLHNLSAEDVIFTGYVSDSELVDLYNICHAFVFPSWHEGFGLPPLEAMSCGAPVIGANTSSVPEVINLSDALFDPFDQKDMLQKIHAVLTDEAFRSRLVEHGLRQATNFSWNSVAKRAISAWETVAKPRGCLSYSISTNLDKQFLHGIASLAKDVGTTASANAIALNEQCAKERQILIDVSELAKQDAATGVQRVVRSYLKHFLQNPPLGFRVEPVFAATNHSYRYARNFTQKFLGLASHDLSDDPIQWQRGDIFFGLDMQHHVQLAQEKFYVSLREQGVIVKFLVHDLLPIQLPDMFRSPDAAQMHSRWLSMIAKTDGAICVSQATRDSLIQWITQSNVATSASFCADWVHNGADISDTQPSKGTPSNAPEIIASMAKRPTFLCVGTIEPRKGQNQVLEAVETLWAEDLDVGLVLVGKQGWKVDELIAKVRNNRNYGNRLLWLDEVSDEFLENIYSSATALIAASKNEGFGLPLVEAAQHGLPVIARDIPVFREVATVGTTFFDGTTPNILADTLIAWLQDIKGQRKPLLSNPNISTWAQSAEKLRNLITNSGSPRRQLLVDVSELAQRDAKTGIQRVVRNILREWLANPPSGLQIEPVYTTPGGHYRYARKFTSAFLGTAQPQTPDESIDIAPGDTFFALDLQPHTQIEQAPFFKFIRNQGATVKFMIYDLLPILQPQYFVPGTDQIFENWLKVVAMNDGAVCISKSVSDELNNWLLFKSPDVLKSFGNHWGHLGADITADIATTSSSPLESRLLNALSSRPSFLMVGTLEPRKGHSQAIDALTELWNVGTEANLVIVGKPGWMVNDVAQKIEQHPEYAKRLFWVKEASDEQVENLYKSCACLLAASFGEGFGLPIVEAAKHRLPVLARDIPVFREVARDHALYFNGSIEELARAISEWLLLFRDHSHPTPEQIPLLSWKESAERILQHATAKKPIAGQ